VERTHRWHESDFAWQRRARLAQLSNCPNDLHPATSDFKSTPLMDFADFTAGQAHERDKSRLQIESWGRSGVALGQTQQKWPEIAVGRRYEVGSCPERRAVGG
jgi:hypothetical protein